MITKDGMVAPLLAALPAFAPEWERFLAEWRDHPDGLPLYILLGRLADRLLDLLASGATEDVARALAVVERWLAEGDPYVRQAATVGLLEDLQNLAQQRGIAPDRIHELLGPEGRFWWRKVDAFWTKAEIIVDHRRMPLLRRLMWWSFDRWYDKWRWRRPRR